MLILVDSIHIYEINFEKELYVHNDPEENSLRQNIRILGYLH